MSGQLYAKRKYPPVSAEQEAVWGSERVLEKTFVIRDLIWDLLTPEDGTDRLSRNVGKKSLLWAA